MSKNAPTPGIVLHRRVRAGFIERGTSLKAWCRSEGVAYSNARDVLIGSWNGPKGKALRARIVDAAQVRE